MTTPRKIVGRWRIVEMEEWDETDDLDPAYIEFDGKGPSRNWLLPGGEESRAEGLPAKCTVQLRAGDVPRVLTPGGGGWGEST